MPLFTAARPVNTIELAIITGDQYNSRAQQHWFPEAPIAIHPTKVSPLSQLKKCILGVSPLSSLRNAFYTPLVAQELYQINCTSPCRSQPKELLQVSQPSISSPLLKSFLLKCIKQNLLHCFQRLKIPTRKLAPTLPSLEYFSLFPLGDLRVTPAPQLLVLQAQRHTLVGMQVCSRAGLAVPAGLELTPHRSFQQHYNEKLQKSGDGQHELWVFESQEQNVCGIPNIFSVPFEEIIITITKRVNSKLKEICHPSWTPKQARPNLRQHFDSSA